MEQTIEKGWLIRWIIDYKIFAAPDETGGAVQPLDPIYRHGIVIEASEKNPSSIVVHCYDCALGGDWVVLHLIHDKVEVLSK